MFSHFIDSFRDFFAASSTATMEVALADSRQDDGSLRFNERAFLRLPLHERDVYLRELNRETAMA
jgi:hypothetical protein